MLVPALPPPSWERCSSCNPAPLSSLHPPPHALSSPAPGTHPFTFCLCEPDGSGDLTWVESDRTCPFVSSPLHAASCPRDVWLSLPWDSRRRWRLGWSPPWTIGNRVAVRSYKLSFEAAVTVGERPPGLVPCWGNQL